MNDKNFAVEDAKERKNPLSIQVVQVQLLRQMQQVLAIFKRCSVTYT
jgi:hypothetical protein